MSHRDDIECFSAAILLLMVSASQFDWRSGHGVSTKNNGRNVYGLS
jgi:hypothetical protein